ncbi:MAG: NAD(P)/FAD-dependent oxidoreductase [Deltaproteobacteria bacterium]|nr:NAD(P)/FAD-dependent oxidoreductase [Deltaproteobacteria bacterium]
MKVNDNYDADILIAGMGVAGSILAYNLKKAGFRILGIEKGAGEDVRTVWTNEVPADVLDSLLLKDIDIKEEFTPEITAVVDQEGKTAFYVDTNRFIKSLDMRHFVISFRMAAEKSGAEIMYNSHISGVKTGNDYVLSEIKKGKNKVIIKSNYLIDCTGIESPVRKNYFKDEIADSDFIYALRYRFRADRKKINEFWDRHKLAYNSAMLRLSENGGFNTTAVYPDINSEKVEILAGGSDRKIKRRIAEIIKREFGISFNPVNGGGGIIPVRRPFLRLYKNRVFSIGDSGSMIYPMCASGVSTIIKASEILLDAFKTDDPFLFQRRFNSLIASEYALMAFFRKIIEEADKEDAKVLFDLVMNPVSIKYVFENRSVVNPENIILSLKRGTRLFARPNLLKKAGIYLLAGSLDSILYSALSSERRADLISLLESRIIKLFTR